MLKEMKEIGEHLRKVEGRGGLDDYLDTGELENYEKIISVDFEKENGTYEFSGVSLIDLAGNESELLYKQGSPRGGDWTPTSRVTRIHTMDEKESPETKMDTISRVFELWYGKLDLVDTKVVDIFNDYRENEERIREVIKQKYEGVEDSRSIVLTVRYENDEGDMSFVREFSLFRDSVREKVVDKWGEKYQTKSKAEEEICSLCNDKKSVFGFAFPFRFYTVDNARFAPDFKREGSWKNLPLCEKCAFDLRIGRNFMESKSFSFFRDIEYYVIPDFPFEGPEEEFMNLMGNEEDGVKYSFLDAEEYYDNKNPEFPLNMDFVFFKKEKNSHKIYKYVEDVNPSHIRETEKTLKKVYEKIISDNDLEEIDYQIKDTKSLQKLSTLLSFSLPNTYGDKSSFMNDFLDLTSKILKKEKISYEMLLSLFSPEVLSRFRSDKNHRGYVLRTFILLTFLEDLKILDHGGEKPMKNYEDIVEDWTEETDENLKKFFEDFAGAFDRPEKKAIFLTGVLSQNLIDAQSMIRQGGPPLRKKLSNLRMTVGKIKNFMSTLFSDIDIYNSKSEYNIEYRDLRESMCTYFAEADNEGWEISDDEVRYYFVLGMSLNRVFKS